MYDIVIVGGGIAGMTAAIYGLRAGKKVMLIEGTTFGGQITLSPHVENYPGIASMSGNEFATTMMEQVSAFGAELNYTKVTAVKKDGNHKIVATEDGEIPCKKCYPGDRNHSSPSWDTEGKGIDRQPAYLTARSATAHSLKEAMSPLWEAEARHCRMLPS